jgi:hypothetical protein
MAKLQNANDMAPLHNPSDVPVDADGPCSGIVKGKVWI